jgi:hypothetical protein
MLVDAVPVGQTAVGNLGVRRVPAPMIDAPVQGTGVDVITFLGNAAAVFSGHMDAVTVLAQIFSAEIPVVAIRVAAATTVNWSVNALKRKTVIQGTRFAVVPETAGAAIIVVLAA